MEINRETLIKLLEAFADSSEVLQHEMMLYQILFTAACKAKGLTEDEIHKAVARGRWENTEKINKVSQATHQRLLARLPRLVDLLASDEDAAMQFLEEWDSESPTN
ncbi:MAG TPA: hypothetical protein VK574_04355 [Terracidiphilus sp.]|nr:hypothetical protein [Terracidiphilus sp.]